MAGQKLIRVLVCLVSVISVGNVGLGCGTKADDCYGFREATVTVAIVEEYIEGTEYQSDDRMWPSSSLRAARVSNSCGTYDALGGFIVIEEEDQKYNNLHCDNHFGRLIDGIKLEYTDGFERSILDMVPTQQEAFLQANLYASGRAELFAGCAGWYSIIVYVGTQYYAGAIIPEDQIFDPPTPGLAPNWLVLRIFECRRSPKTAEILSA